VITLNIFLSYLINNKGINNLKIYPKMANKSIIAIFAIVFVGISLIITIPILTLSSGLSNYGKIDELLTFEYAPDNSSPIEKLNLNVDVGDVEIKYVTTPVDYYAKIQVDIEMTGQLIAGENYSDYFSVVWDITSPSPTFTMLFTSDSWFDPSLLLTQNVDIIITLNANILFDINITINEKGNVHLIVPYAVTINNVDVKTNEGDILYDFRYCTLEGNITGIANEGNIELMANAITINNVDVNTNVGNILYDFQYCTLEGNITGIANEGDIDLMAYNPEYTRNTAWTYNSITGHITIDIIHSNHSKIMNVTITGSVVGNDFGYTTLNYYDNTDNIGAWITINNTVQALSMVRPSDWEGFNLTVLKDFKGEPFGYEFNSTDYPAITNYNLFLEGKAMLGGSTGWYIVNLYSY